MAFVDILGGFDFTQKLIVAASIQNKIAMGKRAGQWVRKFYVHPGEVETKSFQCVSAGGFSLHGAVAIPAKRREKLEKLIRYVARPAIAIERMSQNDKGDIVYKLKRTFSDGTTHVY